MGVKGKLQKCNFKREEIAVRNEICPQSAPTSGKYALLQISQLRRNSQKGERMRNAKAQRRKGRKRKGFVGCASRWVRLDTIREGTFANFSVNQKFAKGRGVRRKPAP